MVFLVQFLKCRFCFGWCCDPVFGACILGYLIVLEDFGNKYSGSGLMKYAMLEENKKPI